MLETPSVLPNPFDPSHPAAPDQFFGREEVFALCRGYLAGGGSPTVPILIGGQGMGKTSILQQLGVHVESRYLIAYFDLQVWDTASGTPGLLYALTLTARAALERAVGGLVLLPPLPDPEAFPDDLRGWLEWLGETHLEPVLRVDRRLRRLTFALDNLSRLFDAIQNGQVGTDFGSLLSTGLAADDRLAVIFSLRSDDEQRLEAFAPAADPLMRKRIGMLDESAARALISDPPQGVYTLESEAVEGILSMASGHPLLLQVINRLIWERSAGRGHNGSITLADVGAVLPDALSDADPILRPVWEQSTPQEQLALLALTRLIQANGGLPVTAEAVRSWLIRETDEALDETAIASALRKLEYQEALRTSQAGRYTFSVGLLHQWLLGVIPEETTPPASDRTVPRRLLLPVLLLIGLLAGAGLLLTQITQGDRVNSAVPTLTLPLDVAATRESIAATQTFEALPTATPTTTYTFTYTPTFTPTFTASATFTPTATATFTATFTPSATYTASATFTPSLTATPTQTFTASATYTPSNTHTPTFTSTATATATATATFTPSPTATPTATFTPTPIPSITPPPFPTGQVLATQAR